MREEVREGEAVELKVWVEDGAGRSVIGGGLEGVWAGAGVGDGEFEDDRGCCG